MEASRATRGVKKAAAVGGAGAAVLEPDYLTCSVCLSLPPGLVLQCPAGHCICAHEDTSLSEGEPSCLAALCASSAAPACPVCRVVLPPQLQRNRVAEQAGRRG